MLDTAHLQRDLRQRSIRGAAVTVVSRVVRAILQVASVAILARMLSPDDYGLYGKVLAVTTLLLILRDMGLGVATIQSAEINQQQVSNLFWLSTGIAVALSLAVAVTAPL